MFTPPKIRSQFRIFLGKRVYRVMRYIQWFRNRKAYNLSKAGPLAHVIFEHETPLIRKLKDVEMRYQYNKVENLKIAAQKLNLLIIEPGQTLSFWRMVGRPTRYKGYKTGFTLQQGKVKPGTGGGLCQLSNLIYWMSLHTPLTVTERHRHGYDVFPDENRKLPFGSGATVSYNYIDLQIQNRTAQNFQLELEIGDTNLRGKWRSDYPTELQFEVAEEDHIIEHAYNGLYVRRNRLRRIIRDGGGRELDSAIVAENNALMMYNPLLEKKN